MVSQLCRANGVDAERLWVFDGDLSRHGDDGALGGAVGETLLDADKACDGGDVDDGAPLHGLFRRGKQQRQEGAGNEVDGANIDVEKAVEIFGLGVLDGANVADPRC